MMHAVDVVAAKLGLDHFALGGNSMGGWVAWRYALAQPARVDALLLIDAAGMPLRKGEKRPESNVGFRILEYPIGRWLATRSEEHTSELQPLMRTSYAVFCLKKKNNHRHK